MEGFKPTIKMKTGGSVSKAVAKCYGGKITKKTGGKIDDADIKQDKAIVKKAFGMHDSQQHEGEKTNLSKLKKGGRSKKETGTVRKFKSGGSVTNVYEAKKSSGDKDNIRKTKDIKPSKAAAPSKAATKPAFKGSDVAKEKSKPAGTPKAKKVSEGPKKADAASGAKEMPNKYKKGGDVKKFADGGSDGYLTPAQERTLKMVKTGNYRSKPNEMNYAQPAPSSNGPTMPSLGPANNFPSSEAYRQAGSPAPQAQKKGGKVKKADGGIMSSLKDNIIGTPEQNRIAQANMDKQAAGGSKLAKFLGGNPAPTNDLVDRSNNFIMGPNGQLIRNPKAAPVPTDDLVDRSNNFIMGPNGQLIRNPKAKPIPAQLLNATSGYADGGSIDDDVRARAMKWIASGSPEQAAAPSAAVKKAPAKLFMPDYSNEDLDRMDAEAADYERKRESTGLSRRYPEKRTPAKMIRDEAEIAQRPTLETKGSKLLKDSGIKLNFKRGGKTC